MSTYPDDSLKAHGLDVVVIIFKPFKLAGYESLVVSSVDAAAVMRDDGLELVAGRDIGW